jgi:hypothetical protein
MKKVFGLFFLAAFIISCDNKEEPKFEAFSPEAFAYDLGDSWEVNATVNVKGFKKVESEKGFSASIDYNVDLINPNGDTEEKVFTDLKEITDMELEDIQLEAQFELDTTYLTGKYKLIFNIQDNNSGESVEITADLDLSE